MKNVIYKLATPVDGVKELVLSAPTRKQLKFAAFIKSSFMSVAMSMAEKLSSDKSDDKKSDDVGDQILSGKDMLSALYAGDVDVGNMLERFQSACTKSSMCQMNDGPIPDEFWDGVSWEDTEGLFAMFLGNFITI